MIGKIHKAVLPPFTEMIWPVMNEALGEAANTMASAISSGLPARFNGTPVPTVPQLRDYFKNDLIPAVAAQQKNYESLDGTSAVNWIAPLLLIVGIVVMLFAAVMIVLNHRGAVSRSQSIAAAAVVPVVGVVVVVLVLALSLIPRTSNGQKLLSGLKPAFTAPRVHGDRAGITMVSAIVNTENPIMTSAGGGGAEVPKLIAFVAKSIVTRAVMSATEKRSPATNGTLANRASRSE